MDPSQKPLKTLTLYHILMALIKDEEKVTLQIKESKKEVIMSNCPRASSVFVVKHITVAMFRPGVHATLDLLSP